MKRKHDAPFDMDKKPKKSKLEESLSSEKSEESNVLENMPEFESIDVRTKSNAEEISEEENHYNIGPYEFEGESSEQQFTLQALPFDALVEVLKYLSLKDLSHLMQVNDFFNSIANHQYVWNDKITRFNITDWENKDPKQRVRMHLSIPIIQKHIPEELINIFGLSTFTQLPKLNLGNHIQGSTGYITVSPMDLGEYAIAWGVDNSSRPYIAFQYTVDGRLFDSHCRYVDTLFRRYSDGKIAWASSSSGYNEFLQLHGHQTLTPSFLNHLRRKVEEGEVQIEPNVVARLYPPS